MCIKYPCVTETNRFILEGEGSFESSQNVSVWLRLGAESWIPALGCERMSPSTEMTGETWGWMQAGVLAWVLQQEKEPGKSRKTCRLPNKVISQRAYCTKLLRSPLPDAATAPAPFPTWRSGCPGCMPWSWDPAWVEMILFSKMLR